MKALRISLVLALAYAAPLYAQSSQVHVVEKAAHEGFLAKCQQDESPEAKKGCALFTRLVAFRLQHLGWGLLTKSAGENNYEGYAVDAIVHRDTLAVFDIISGTETPGARAAWTGPQPRRPHNVYVAPIPLTASEMAFLGGGSAPTPESTPIPQPPVVDLSAILARLDALEAESAAIKRDTADIRNVIAAESKDLRAIIAAIPFPIYKGSVFGIAVISRPCASCR